MKNNTTRISWPVIGVVALATLLRLLLLGIKPPHFDEGVNGWFVDEMTRHGYYHYDPGNYHGPLHFYLLFLFQTVLGRSIWALRLPVVAVSVLSVFWVTKFDRFFGRGLCWFAALAMAVSPGMVFYGRYGIHEPELVFFLMLMAWGFAGLWQFGDRKYLWALGMGLTGTVLTKETYFIHLACFLLAAATLWLFEKLSASEPLPRAVQRWKWPDLAGVTAAGAGLVLFFYSGGFLDFSSLPGLYKTYAAWFETGTHGNGHEKPFYYWLKLMLQYEWMALPGLVGCLWLLRPGTGRLLRWLAIYGGGTLVAYSLVPYKTPWCIITLIWPFFFVSGYLANECSRRWKWITLAVSTTLCAATLASTVWLNFHNYTNEAEPYVYVQTLKDINKLSDPLYKLAAADPANYHITGHIILASYHPIPWLLGDFTSIGYYNSDT
ncbi:MAG: flippase activity-associated protein Agl23, partial [Verrucomicrobiota bacterium]